MPSNISFDKNASSTEVVKIAYNFFLLSSKTKSVCQKNVKNYKNTLYLVTKKTFTVD